MTMISLGGVIGAGLFVGSGAVMSQTGPAAFVSYLLAGATILQRWLPGVPVWVTSLGVMVLLTGTNLVSVRSYGEFEF
jgi:L-asparagine transporter-like permease